MKRFKQIAALLLAAVLTLSMSLPAMAATNEDTIVGTPDDTGAITVTGIQDEHKDSVTVTAYPIILATYDENGNFSGYISLYPDYISVEDVAMEDGKVAENLEANLDQLHNALREGLIAEEDQPVFGTDNAGNTTVTVQGVTYIVGNDAKSSSELEHDDENSTDTTATFTAELPIGAYLIDIRGAEATEYNVAIASSYYTTTDDGTDNEVKEGTVTMGISEENAWVKTETPNDDKYITAVTSGGEVSNPTGGSKGTSANIGDVITYNVIVNDIPHYGGDFPTFYLVDHLSDGLEYVENSISVKIVDAQGTTVVELTQDEDYTFAYNEEDNTLKIDFVVDGDYTLNIHEGLTISITYDATLTDAAALNDLDNPNCVDLIFTTDSTVNADDVYGPYNPDNPDDNNPEDPRTHKRHQTHTYTFDIDGQLEGSGEGLESGPGSTGKGSLTYDIVTKTGAETMTVYVAEDGSYISEDDYNNLGPMQQQGYTKTEINLPLDGAKFTIYTDAACTEEYEYKNAATVKEVTDESSANAWTNPVVSTTDGKLNIVGLAEGTYYLKETEAPEGYTLNTTIYKIDITCDWNDDGTLNTWTVAIQSSVTGEDGTWADEGSSTFTVTQQVETVEDNAVTAGDDGNSVTIELKDKNGETISVDFTKVSEETYGSGEYEETVTTYEGVYTFGSENANGVYTVDEYHFTAVKTTDASGNSTWEVTGTLTSIATDNEGNPAGEDTEIKNTKIVELPSTGGMGTILFTVIGCLIMILAASAYIFNRRRNRVAQ